MSPLWLLFGFLLGWVVAQVQEKALKQELRSQLQESQTQLRVLESRLELEKVKVREQHLALDWDLQ